MNDKMFTSLRDHNFLSSMPDTFVQLIADCAEFKDFSADAYLMRQNQNADFFYLLLKGKVCLRLPTPQGMLPVETVAAPAALGWSWLVPPFKWQYDAFAQDNTKTILVHTPCILGKVEHDKDFGCDIYRRFIEVVVDRLHGAQMQMMDVYAKPEFGTL